MPLYEYQCDACAHRFELIQKFSDPPAETCPACGGSVRKLLSSPAIQFKGTGWYITDYARAGKSDGPSKGGDKGEGSGEAKPAATTESKGESSAGRTESPPKPKSSASASSSD